MHTKDVVEKTPECWVASVHVLNGVDEVEYATERFVGTYLPILTTFVCVRNVIGCFLVARARANTD